MKNYEIVLKNYMSLLFSNKPLKVKKFLIQIIGQKYMDMSTKNLEDILAERDLFLLEIKYLKRNLAILLAEKEILDEENNEIDNLIKSVRALREKFIVRLDEYEKRISGKSEAEKLILATDLRIQELEKAYCAKKQVEETISLIIDNINNIINNKKLKL